MMTLDKHSAATTWCGNKEVWDQGDKSEYPEAIVKAHIIARDPEGSSSVC